MRELAALNNELAQIVASNIFAPPKLLEELASHESKAVRKLVTNNPNTPIKTLLRLGEYFPQELLANPVFNFLALKDINIVQNITLDTLTSLIQQPKIPSFILD